MATASRMRECSPSKLEQPSSHAEMRNDADSLALALRLQEEEHAYAGLWMASESVNESQEESPEEAESLALAIRLQQEDDEAQLRATLGLTGSQEDPVSPSSLSYEQLLQLGSTIGTVSKGASSESIRALDRMTVAEARMCKSVILGEQCSICRMEFDDDDELQMLPCNHCEHAECLSQWLAMSKCCPLCQAEEHTRYTITMQKAKSAE